MPEVEVRCSRCGRPLADEPAAAISATIMGDECTDCYYWCDACEVYTLRLCRDVFTGPEVTKEAGPFDRDEGERKLALIRACPEPWDGRCRCPAHRAYFDGWLD